MSYPCPLCVYSEPDNTKGPMSRAYHQDQMRSYFQCSYCDLVFVHPKFRLSLEQQKQHYQFHQNEVDDPGYRQFLSRLAEPLLSRLGRPAQGLDFGCGAGPALAAMLSEAGHRVTLFDPIYAQNPSVFSRQYDFICATEVLEHLSWPGFEVCRLWHLLRPGGWLAVMTKRVHSLEKFRNWHYKNDPTHVVFFSLTTFEYLARVFRAEIQIPAADIALLKKPV